MASASSGDGGSDVVGVGDGKNGCREEMADGVVVVVAIGGDETADGVVVIVGIGVDDTADGVVVIVGIGVDDTEDGVVVIVGFGAAACSVISRTSSAWPKP